MNTNAFFRKLISVHSEGDVMRDEELIKEYIEPNPHRVGIAEARLKQYGISVWALIGHLAARENDLVQVALDYDIPPDAVKAACAYYERHRALIDARLAANAPDVDPILSAA
jgi:uncharacterized protein (DUF433 family)